jgi:hypothetical protein
MAPPSTLLEQMKRNPAGDWTIADIQAVCRQYGVTCYPPVGGGSHYKLSDDAVPEVLIIPYRRPVKPIYIRLLIRFIGGVLAARGASE